MYFYLYAKKKNVTTFYQTLFNHMNGGMKNRSLHIEHYSSAEFFYGLNIWYEHTAVTLQLTIANTFRDLKGYSMS